MISKEKYLTTLEYDKIRMMLADCAATEGARSQALCLLPSEVPEIVKRNLSNTTDAKRLSYQKGTPSFGHVADITDATSRALRGATLTTRELLDIANVLATARSLCGYISEDKNFETSLDDIFDLLVPVPDLENRIRRAIIAEDMISDDASAELAAIRRKIKRINIKIRDDLQSYISGGSYSKYLQENIVTTRVGRYVIPVKAEHKNDVRGLVHDTSASGATVFIEPIAVVEANNELRMLESEEKAEVEKILSDLSSLTAQYSAEANLDYETVTRLAFIFAKAEFSHRIEGCEPIICEERTVDLTHARHPLLDKKTCVPINLKIGGEYDTLIITGPNTGGKTVALKTLGLFSLMVQSGLHVPCEDTSRICIFDSVLADIGDEQSIEQSLSTFSAHMKRTVEILGTLDRNSLVLFDELGSGTDPVEGAALATSIIDAVREKGAICAATTHYAELKAYALETEGVCNASCEFDIETLRPTYRIVIGTPGKSNAFAISKKLGLSDEVIRRAESYVASDNKRFENVIEKLEKARISAEKNELEARRMRKELSDYKEREEKRLAGLSENTEKEIARARAQALSMLNSAKAASQAVFEELEKLKKEKDREKAVRALEESRAKVRRSLNKVDTDIEPIPEDEDYTPSRPIQKGDEVFIKGVGKHGIVLNAPDSKGNVQVSSGALTVRTKVDKLILAFDKGVTFTDKEGKTTSARDFKQRLTKSFSPELDLRGMTGEEAWFVVDKYIDDAMVMGVHTVTLVHGKGTGALRAFLQKTLRSDRRVESFRNGKYGEGDAGVTVVELK